MNDTSEYVWFETYRCNCTLLVENRGELTTRCATHGEYRLGAPLLVKNRHNVPLGLEPSWESKAS